MVTYAPLTQIVLWVDYLAYYIKEEEPVVEEEPEEEEEAEPIEEPVEGEIRRHTHD